MSKIIIIGEANVNNDRDKYNCTFAKMIQAWRNVWHTRTNAMTDPTFPFGFVQVRSSFVINFMLLIISSLVIHK